MKKHFYSYLIEVEKLNLSLDKLEISPSEKKELLEIADSMLYHEILNTVLSQLNEEDKKLFLSHLAKDNSDEIWKFLNSRVENIEDKIKKAAEALTDKLHKDIK